MILIVESLRYLASLAIISRRYLYAVFLMAFGIATFLPAQSPILRRFDETSFAAAPHLSLSAAAIAIDDEDDRADLTFVRSAVFLADGSVATLSSMGTTNLLAHFDLRGRLLRTLGGTVSSGPGDFRRPTGLAAAVGDTVFVVDAGNNRLNRVLMNSGRVEVVRFDTPQFTRHSLIVGVLPGERFVLTESWTLPTNLPGTPTNTNRSVVIALRNGTSRKVASLVDLRVSQVETRFRRLDTMTVMTRLAPQAALVIWDTLIITSSGEPPIDKKEVRRIEATTPFSDSLPLFKKLFTTSDGCCGCSSQLRQVTRIGRRSRSGGMGRSSVD